jgi:DNA-binding transcriptional regulator PaaX
MSGLAHRIRIRIALALMLQRGHVERITRENGEVAYRLTEAGERHYCEPAEDRKAAA